MRDSASMTDAAPEAATVDVSVIMPSYNSEAFIEGALASIFHQQGVGVEAIVVDDEGTDRTRAILDPFQADWRNLVVLHRPPKGGQATARNDGIKAARGRYVAFLDSDDRFDGLDVLAQWVAHADQHALDISCGQFTVATPMGAINPGRRIAPLATPVTVVGSAPHLVNVTSCWQLLYRTSFLREHGLLFSSKLRQREDRLFFVEALLAADRIGVTDASVVRHLNHPGSSFHQIDLDQLRQYTIHVQEMRGVIDRAAAAGRLAPNFAAANAQVSWQMLFRYWAPFILQCLGDWQRAAAVGPPPQTPEVAAVMEFFEAMKRLSAGHQPYYTDTLLAPRRSITELNVEGTLDVGRLAIELGRVDYLTRMLAGGRLLFSEARSLVGDGAPDWAEDVVCRYLVFHRGHIFPKPADDAVVPALADLVKRVVLHVGPPKTGSSALQQTLERNRLRLLRAGVHYPLSGTRRVEGVRRERTDGHARLVERIIRGDSGVGRDLALEVLSIDTPVHTLVLSSENIVSHRFWDKRSGREGADLVERIAATLGVPNIEVMILLRRQDQWFRSYYREVISNPFNKIIDSPEEFFANLRARGLFDYEHVIAALAAPAAVQAVHVEAYETVRARAGTVAWALDRIGVRGVEIIPPPAAWTNESLSDATAANIRIAKFNRDASRTELSDMFEAATKHPELASSRYALVGDRLLGRLSRSIAVEIAAFDARFPVATATRTEPDISAPLPVLPQICPLIDRLRVPEPNTVARVSVTASSVTSLELKPLSKAARLRKERIERPALAGAALADASISQLLQIGAVLPLIRLFRGPRQARLFATRVLTTTDLEGDPAPPD